MIWIRTYKYAEGEGEGERDTLGLERVDVLFRAHVWLWDEREERLKLGLAEWKDLKDLQGKSEEEEEEEE